MIYKHDVYSWVCKYLEWLDTESRKVKTTRILSLEIKVNYDNSDDPYVGYIIIKKNKRKIYDEDIWGLKTTNFVKGKYKPFDPDSQFYKTSLDCALGDCFEIRAAIYDSDGIINREVAVLSKFIYPGFDDLSAGIDLDCVNKRKLKREGNNVFGRLIFDKQEGDPLEKWLKNNPFPER